MPAVSALFLKGVVAEYYGGAQHSIGTTIVSEFYSRVISFAIILIGCLFLQDYIDYSNINWGNSLFITACVIVGGVFYTYALINTDQPTIHIMYYFVPLFAVIILWLAGETTINSGLFIGGSMIVLCNLYLYFAGRKAPSVDAL